MDIGSVVGRAQGVTEEQLMELPRYAQSAAFSALEKLALDYAVAMARTPVQVPAELVAALSEHLAPAQLVELTAAIAWEHFRARFNRALGVSSDELSAGAFCAVPEHPHADAPG
jgi:alkylhydroperoxidase family enzyme